MAAPLTYRVSVLACASMPGPYSIVVLTCLESTATALVAMKPASVKAAVLLAAAPGTPFEPRTDTVTFEVGTGVAFWTATSDPSTRLVTNRRTSLGSICSTSPTPVVIPATYGMLWPTMLLAESDAIWLANFNILKPWSTQMDLSTALTSALSLPG